MLIELHVLKEGLESLINSKDNDTIQSFRSVFGFNAKFFENLIYLSGIADRGDDEADTTAAVAAAAGSDNNTNICDICAIVFLKLPSYILLCNQQQATHLVSDKIHFDADSVNISSVSSLKWIDICKLFHSYILNSTASLLVGIGPRALSSGDYLTCLIKAITLLRPNTSISAIECSNTDMTFSQYIHSVNTRINQRKSDQADSNNEISVEDEEDYIVQRMVQDIWIHLIFLTRDLLIQFPELLPKTLPQLCESLLTEEGVSEFLSVDRKTFPTSAECLLVLIFSSIAVSLSSIPQSSSNTSSSSEEDVKATMIKKQVRVKRITAARVCLKKLIDPIIDKLTDIIERMLHHSPDKGVEAAAMLCDIIQLFTTIDESVTTTPLLLKESINSSHEKLISSRLLSILVKIWIDLLSGTSNDRSGNNMIATVSRITRILSVICLQRVESGAFLIRLPNFIKSINTIIETWNINNDVIVKSGCLISLLLGLLASIDAGIINANNNSASSQLELALQSTMKNIIDEFTRINLILSSKDLDDSNTGRLIRSDNALPLIDSLSICIEAYSIKLLSKTHKDVVRLWTMDIVNITNTITSKIISKKSNQSDVNDINSNMVDKSLDSLDDNLSFYDDIRRLCKGFRSLLEEQETTKID